MANSTPWRELVSKPNLTMDEALANFRRALKATPEYKALERFVGWLARKLERHAPWL